MPTPLYWPGGQLEHAAVADPVAALTSVLPTPQDWHAEAPEPEYSPVPQLSHASDSLDAASLPASQSENVFAPDSLYLPDRHVSQASASVPVSESTNFLPFGQAVHVGLDAAEYEPVAHVSQLLLLALLKLPAKQSLHALVSLPVSTCTLRLPAAQTEHTAAEAPLYVPALQ